MTVGVGQSSCSLTLSIKRVDNPPSLICPPRLELGALLSTLARAFPIPSQSSVSDVNKQSGRDIEQLYCVLIKYGESMKSFFLS